MTWLDPEVRSTIYIMGGLVTEYDHMTLNTPCVQAQYKADWTEFMILMKKHTAIAINTNRCMGEAGKISVLGTHDV